VAPSFTIRRGLGAAALLIALGCGVSIARAQAPVVPEPPGSDTEKWVWSQLVRAGRAGPVALDRHCPDAYPDPKNGKDARWRDSCRTVSARFLRGLLTRCGSMASPLGISAASDSRGP
jgi:hypothetical protein